jgi:signal transduction histidine kinase/CheY-like chemotaxis protein
MLKNSQIFPLKRNFCEWLILVVALALVGAVVLYIHQVEVSRVESSERERLQVFTDFVANDILRNLTTVNFGMAGVINDYLMEQSTDASSHFLTLRLKALQGAIPGVRAFAVINATGTVTHASSSELNALQLSYRDYFKEVRDHPSAATLYISVPFQSFKREPDLVIAASRMVRGADGAFNGLVVAVLDKEYFSTPFSMGLYAPDVWAIVVHGDGQQIMNFPERKKRIDGTNLDRKGTFFRRHIDSGRVDSMLTGRVYTTGEYRLMNLRTIRSDALRMNKAIVIGLSRELSAIALPLQRHALTSTLFFLALVVISTVLLRWTQIHRDKVEAADAALELDRRKAEEDIRQNKAELESEKRFRHLIEDARDVAEAASRSKADFLANMSHEIRTPLNAILGLTYLLERVPLSVDAKEMVDKIQSSGRMLLAIINDVLDLSKIESGHMMIEEAAFRLSDVIDNVAATMGVVVGDKDIQLIVHPGPAGIASLLGDSIRLEQILNNLTGNAIKFTHVGHVALRVTLASQDARSVVLRFSITDTGIGIDPDLQEEVFSVFTQADTSITRRFGGSGLGLSICRRLVSLMGGEMGVVSALDAGSEFWFTLPFQLIDETNFSPPTMVRLEALIADDSDIALKVVGDIALGLGWTVNSVSSGDAVMTHLLAARSNGVLPDIVILDWKMPGMDGMATARTIREVLTPGECPIVIMATANSLSALAQQPGAELVDAMLNKPVTASALFNATIAAQCKRATDLQPVWRSSNHILEGIRVLVVDDSEINRDVAQRILLAHGAQVILATDGKEALDWLFVHPDAVDLVLMDVQMPNMDGLEATRQLRQLRQFDDLPIVALTAGAFRSQQEAALAAGMSHFISKPIDVPMTIGLIQRIRRGSPAAAPGRADKKRTDSMAVVSSSGSSVIDVHRGLQIWTDVDVYRGYLRRFASGYGNAADVISAHLVADDPIAAAALAHKLAGAAAHLGLPDTHRLAIQVERMLVKELDASAVLERLSTALVEVLAAIDRFAPPPIVPEFAILCETDAQGALSEESRLLLQSRFTALMAAIDTDNPMPIERVLNELLAWLPEARLSRIRDSVEVFDFRSAEAASMALADELGISP